MYKVWIGYSLCVMKGEKVNIWMAIESVISQFSVKK